MAVELLVLTLLAPVPKVPVVIKEEHEDSNDLLEEFNIIIMLRADDAVVNRNKWGAAGILLLVPQLLVELLLGLVS
jgi:hypothetical protein